MIAGARYGHADLVARDWKALSRFYQDLEGNILEIQSRPR